MTVLMQQDPRSMGPVLRVIVFVVGGIILVYVPYWLFGVFGLGD